MLPFSSAAERNKEPLLEVLGPMLRDQQLRVLEVGSGTGQHAVHFARAFPSVTWQTSDLPANHATIRAWLDEHGPANALAPVALDADDFSGAPAADVVFTANTLHIMSWHSARRLLHGVGALLQPGGRLIVYGPFRVGGAATSASNERFDRSLRASNTLQGVRDREQVCWNADAAGLSLTSRTDMPANNQVLVFERRAD